MKRIMTTLVVLAACATISFGQGALAPTGAPAPGMKTLDQVEPRTPISSTPYTISEPGSYYLTTNLTSTSHGVVITTNGVTLDLMGFTISGDRGSSDYGVILDGSTNSPAQNIVVRNGIVRNFSIAIKVTSTKDSRLEHLLSTANLYHGIYFSKDEGPCNGNSIANCTFSGNGRGIYLNGGNGNTIVDCAVNENEDYGIFLGSSCEGNTIADCTINGNGSHGVRLYGSNGQCNGNTITDCTIRNNTSAGIQLARCDGNSIVDCNIRGNGVYGIDLYHAKKNRVEGNHITDQTGITTYGIYCSSTSENLILRNTCVGQTYNFVMNANDTYGPIITTSGPLLDTNPWANFSR